MSGAVASQPLCLIGVHRDSFMGGVGAKGRKYKGTKLYESMGYACGKSGGVMHFNVVHGAPACICT